VNTTLGSRCCQWLTARVCARADGSVTLTSSRLKAWDSRVPMSGCLGAHHSTAVSQGLLRSRRPTLSLAGATPAMPAASLVTFPDAGRCRDLGISPGDSVVAHTVTAGADNSRRACPRPEGRGLRATFSMVNPTARYFVTAGRRDGGLAERGVVG
jgi:hypothetical protein